MFNNDERLPLKRISLEPVFDFDDYDPTKLPPLSAEDQKKWYAKYYLRGRVNIPEEVKRLCKVGCTMCSDKALVPGKNIDNIMEPEVIRDAQGYCELDNGVGYGFVRTELPTISFELFSWYKKVRLKDDLLYKIWYPGAHISENGGKIIEDVGLGPEQIEFAGESNITEGGGTVDTKSFLKMIQNAIGLSRSPLKVDPSFIMMIGGNGYMYALDDIIEKKNPRALTLFHYVCKLPNGGCEFRTFFYVGAFCIDGELVRTERYEPGVALEISRRMLSHCIYERNNLPTFLPELYAEWQEHVN